MAVEFFDLRHFDLVISDTSSFAKGVITNEHTLHICYCHTPTRYLWSDTHQYISELKYNKYFKKLISLVLNYIRIWDRLAADRVDTYVANSKFVVKRIKKYYKRDARVIYPPVEVNKYKIADILSDYFLIGGRLSPYKRVDIVIEAFKELGLKLKIFGDGIDMKRLKEIVGDNPNIEFLGRVDEQAKIDLFSHCQAFLYPQEEDFGITAVEAMAAGRPVIAYRSGGATESVIENVTGVFFDEQTKESIIAGVNNFTKQRFDPERIQEHAQQFSEANFKRNITQFIDEAYRKFKNGEL
jgi:glycosyltransferase involved in cell wall biosynthesis